jgi:hypothetical protein
MDFKQHKVNKRLMIQHETETEMETTKLPEQACQQRQHIADRVLQDHLGLG